MNIDIVRAWKDATYRANLSAEEQALLPAHPAGTVELSDAELEMVHGTSKEKEKERVTFVNNNHLESGAMICVHTALIPIDLAAVVGTVLGSSTATQANNCPDNSK